MTRHLGGLLLISLMLVIARAAIAAPPGVGQDQQVGPADNGGVVVPSGQRVRPAGITLSYPGMPVDLCLSPDGSSVFVKYISGIVVIDLGTWQVRQHLKYVDELGSMHGIATWRDEKEKTHVLVSGAHKSLMEAVSGGDRTLSWARVIELPGAANVNLHATGIAVSADHRNAYVCLSRNNSLAIVDLGVGKLIEEIPVGICPYSIVLEPSGGRAYVSNFGGRKPKAGEKTEQTSGTQMPVDARSIGISGTISVVDFGSRQTLSEIEVGLHPAQIVLSRDGGRLYVANANSDAVSVVDTREQKQIGLTSIRADDALPFGSIPNALLLSADEQTLYCANAGMNSVAVIALDPEPGKNKVKGFMPTGWFPGALVSDGKSLIVANVKGEGSRSAGPAANARKTKERLGSITRVELPIKATDLEAMTAQVRADARVPETLRAMERAATGAEPLPVPKHWGEPSPIQHVVFVLKENRTYDQVFGDMPRGNGEPKLCHYGRAVSPNHHALADEFVLLDNYYCSGVNSADGHQWATQGIVTDYQIKESGGNTRSYDFGTDALCYAASDFIWDSVLLAGLSFRNYGEFDFPTITSGQKNWFDVYRDWDAGKVTFKQSIEVEALRKYSCKEYPGWQMHIPDAFRLRAFLKEFREYEKNGNWPNFIIVYLPQDHTQGTDAGAPTPRAHIADNDEALGQLVEAISNSRFWASTCIFVNEDDPQDGYDHVDGHRSICLVAGPHVKRGQVVSHFYNQSSVLHTITQILGVPPLNQMVAQAPTMEDCFTETPDLRPFKAVARQLPIDEPNKLAHLETEEDRKLADAARRMDFSRPDRIDDNLFNRILWRADNPGKPYPAEFAGAHGKGLGKLGLKLAPAVVDEDEDEKKR